MLIQKQLKQLYIFNRKCKNKKKMGITEKYCENTYIAKEVGSLMRRSFKAYIIESCLQIENPYIKQRRIANPPQRREHPPRRVTGLQFVLIYLFTNMLNLMFAQYSQHKIIRGLYLTHTLYHCI